MRSKSFRGERRIEEALAALVRALRRAQLPWMVIGGIAIIARGVRRMTTDIDAVVRGDRVDLSALLRFLAQSKIVPRIDDIHTFASESLVLLLRHEPTGVELDVSMGWTAFEHEAIAACSEAKYGVVSAPMARAEDLVVFKTMAARPKDIEDASTLLLMHHEIDIDRVRRRLGELAAMADEPSLVVGLEQVIKLSTTRPATPKPPSVSSARTKPRVQRKTKPRMAKKIKTPPRA